MATAPARAELDDDIGPKYITHTVTFDADAMACGVDLLVKLEVNEDEPGSFSMPEIKITGGALEESPNDLHEDTAGALFRFRSTQTLRVLARMLVEVADLAERGGLIPALDQMTT